MEPHAHVAAWTGDKLTLWTSTQGISDAHKAMVALFGVASGDVTVLCPYVGGGFGSKGLTWPPAALAAMAARAVQRPVKLVVTREQMYTSNGYRPRTVQKLQLSAAADGTLTSVRHDVIAQMSMQQLGNFAESSALATRMLYACPAIATTHRVVDVNQGLPTFMRAPGEASGVFALESAMDELAVALKMDPLALRLKNYAETDPTEDKPFASKGLRECYAKAAERFGWSRRSAAPRSMRDGNLLVGWGMATAIYDSGRYPTSASAALLAEGTALVRCATTDMGPGTYTSMTQVAAEALGLPMARVRFELGDSTFPKAKEHGGSTTMASVGPAVQEACAAVKVKLAALGEGTDFAAVLRRAGLDRIEAEARVQPDDAMKTHSINGFGAVFAEVRVDVDLCTIRASRIIGAYDAGRIVNPKLAHSQCVGGMVQGIGMALFEEVEWDEHLGRVANGTIAEYIVPVNADVHELDAIFVDTREPLLNPLGVKGVAELGLCGVAPAIANAVWHATGKRVRDLPITPDRLLTA